MIKYEYDETCEEARYALKCGAVQYSRNSWEDTVIKDRAREKEKKLQERNSLREPARTGAAQDGPQSG